MYGENMSTYSGATNYNLTDKNTVALDVDGDDGTISIGQAYYTIWDTGTAIDEIKYSGIQKVYINLNEASLELQDSDAVVTMIKNLQEMKGFTGLPSVIKDDITDVGYHAGGFISRVFGDNNFQEGGFSIANGVKIENATGGDGNDFLVGNGEINEIIGNKGNDVLYGAGGNDTLKAGEGNDELQGEANDDSLNGGAGSDTAVYSGACEDYEIVKNADNSYTITDKRGVDGIDTLIDVEKIKYDNHDEEQDIGHSCKEQQKLIILDNTESMTEKLYQIKEYIAEYVHNMFFDSETGEEIYSRVAVMKSGIVMTPFTEQATAAERESAVMSAIYGTYGNGINEEPVYGWLNKGMTDAQEVGSWKSANDNNVRNMFVAA
jgi:hypothetical protein